MSRSQRDITYQHQKSL